MTNVRFISEALRKIGLDFIYIVFKASTKYIYKDYISIRNSFVLKKLSGSLTRIELRLTAYQGGREHF